MRSFANLSSNGSRQAARRPVGKSRRGHTGLDRTSTQPLVVRADPNKVSFRLAVDERWDRGLPIDRSTDQPVLKVNGQSLADQRGMRQGLRTVAEHRSWLEAQRPGEQIVAMVGNGNLLANPFFVAYSNGNLYRLADEPVFQRKYSSVVYWKNGKVTIETVWYGEENCDVIVLRGWRGAIQDITDAVAFAVSGQPLVQGGAVVPAEQVAEQWYDTRHLVQPLRLTVNKAVLFVPNAQLQRGLTRKGLLGPVHIRAQAQVDEETALPLTAAGWLRAARETPEVVVKAVEFLKSQGVLDSAEEAGNSATLLRAGEMTERLLDEALVGGGYRIVDGNRPLGEGEVRFVNGHMEVHLKRAIYPHNMLVCWPDGRFGFVVFPGKSGREGTTLRGAQQFLTEQLGVRDAVLLDNGGDVRLWFRSQYLVPSSEGREEIRSVLALAVPKGTWCGDAVSVY